LRQKGVEFSAVSRVLRHFQPLVFFMDILLKLRQAKSRFEEIQHALADPAVLSDSGKYADLSREYADLRDIVDLYDKLEKADSDLEANREMLKMEPELAEMAQAEIERLKEEKAGLLETLKVRLLPKDPTDAKNAIVEIRAGTGGDEAAIFAGDLFWMYRKYAEAKGWQMEVLGLNESSKGGYKEIVFQLSGPEIFGHMKFESGVHRVQRVPATEAQGRVHTSAATVAVLPEVDEVTVQINPADLEFDTFRSSGAGGQHVNKTESAVRIRHKPSGIVVECQEERSQHKNRDKAMKMLRARLYESEFEKQQQERAANRKSQVSTGDRSAKIRTYNFPQGRLTDHRIDLTLYKLDDIIKGDLEDVITALRLAEQLEKLESAD
jgi:peptide chain release factor 1